MKLLLHVCCGPCAAYPVSLLQGEGISVRGFFYNPNIHPYREFRKRLAAMEELAAAVGIEVDYHREYGLCNYLRAVVFNEEKRCRLCYEMRLHAAAEQAKRTGADAFSTTLLYSRYQNHDLIQSRAEEISAEYSIPFYYHDFRSGWQEGIDLSKEMGLYRQSYCGCIYSEQERYDKQFRKQKKKAD